LLVGRATARVTYEESATGVATSTRARTKLRSSPSRFFHPRARLYTWHYTSRDEEEESRKSNAIDISVVRRDPECIGMQRNRLSYPRAENDYRRDAAIFSVASKNLIHRGIHRASSSVIERHSSSNSGEIATDLANKISTLFCILSCTPL
jgi:hypothetical protein